MATLNRLLNLLSYVINICWMCFVYLTFDTAQNSLALQYQMSGCTRCAKNIWKCLEFEKQLAWGAVPSHWTSCTVVFGATALEVQVSMHVLMTVFPGRLIFNFTDFIWTVHSLIMQNQTIAFGTVSKASTQNTTCQIGGLKLWVCSVLKGAIKNALCCDILSTMNIAVHWMIWWSPMRTEWYGGHLCVLNDMVVTYVCWMIWWSPMRHIQTVMI